MNLSDFLSSLFTSYFFLSTFSGSDEAETKVGVPERRVAVVLVRRTQVLSKTIPQVKLDKPLLKSHSVIMDYNKPINNNEQRIAWHHTH